MTLKNRISLVVFGVIVFFLTAPFLLFFARGYRPDFKNKKIVKTGVLSIKTDPKGATVFLNGKKLKQTTPLAKRFLNPGEYQVRVEKTGFSPWSKRIVIREQSVSYLPQGETEKIMLFIQNPEPVEVATSTWNDLKKSDEEQSGRNLSIAEEERIRLLTETLPDGTERIITPAPLPPFTTAKIIPTPQGQIFLLLDQNLYQVSEPLERINDEVRYAFWQKNTGSLLYGNDHEIWQFDPFDRNRNRLLTRSSRTLSNPYLSLRLGYLFFTEENQIKALELDQIGQPNAYVFAVVQSLHPKFFLSSDESDLFYQDGEQVINLKIR